MALTSSKSLSWWKKPMTVMGHLCPGSRVPDTNKALVKFKKSLGFDAEHWLSSEVMMASNTGGDDGTFLFKNNSGCIEDRLTDYVTAAHLQNLKIIVYVNVHWFKPEFGEQYFLRDSAGKMINAYGSGALVCPAGPFLDWSIQIARDLGRYPVDGMFLDGPMNSLCYCDSCQKQFQEKYGRPIPVDLANSTVEERQWVREFPLDCFVRYLQMVKAAFNENNPDGVLYHNGEAFGKDGVQNQAAISVVDLLGAEGGFVGYSPLKSQFRFYTSATAKLLEAQAKGKPTMVYIDFGFKCYDYYSHTEHEVSRIFASSVANGASTWFMLYPSGKFTPGIQEGIKMNSFVQKYRGALTGTQSLARIAMLYSDLNINLNQKQQSAQDDVHSGSHGNQTWITGNHSQCIEGFYSALTYSQAIFDIILDETLESMLHKYDLLILPSVLAMTPKTVNLIRNFVQSGGNLLATFDTSLYDHYGNLQDDYALSDIFGCHAGDMLPESGLDYIGVQKQNWFTQDIAENILPRPRYSRYVRLHNPRAQSLMFYYEPMSRRYAMLPPVSDQPVVVFNKCKRGRVVFVPSALGEYYREYGFQQYRQMIANVAKKFSKQLIKTSSQSNFLEISVRQNEAGNWLVHLINLATSDRPVESVFPQCDLVVELEVTKKVQKVYATLSTSKIHFRQDKNSLRLILPVLKSYDMIVIEFGSGK